MSVVIRRASLARSGKPSLPSDQSRSIHSRLALLANSLALLFHKSHCKKVITDTRRIGKPNGGLIIKVELVLEQTVFKQIDTGQVFAHIEREGE